MMFNGLVMCGDSDSSDYLKGSSGASSVAGSVSGTRALQDKLQATLQILKNKEETVRVQAQSLALAEARLATLARSRSSSLQKQSAAECKVEVTDAPFAANSQAVSEDTVNTLRDNLCVVQDLYRDCFFESARQQQLLESYRSSCLDLRWKERQKDSQVTHLKLLVDTQRSSAQAYQNIALEVDHLKTEITNYLNNPNNDSGMWERRSECDVSEELHQIGSQLQRLQELLSAECTCGLDSEHKELKRTNDNNERLIGELREKISRLEEAVGDKDNEEQRYMTRIAEKDSELNRIREQMESMSRSQQRDCRCQQRAAQLQTARQSLKEKTSELNQAERACEEHEQTIRELKEELARADEANRENNRVREEISALSAEVSSWRSQLDESRCRLRHLQAELQHSRHRADHLAAHYREKTNFAYELQSQLEEAQTRGATLCDEARHVVSAVRRCLRRQKERQRQQEQRLQQQEELIRSLQNSRTESDRLGPASSKPMSSASDDPPPTPPRRQLRKKSSADVVCRWTRASACTQQPVRSSCATSVSIDRCTRVCSPSNCRAVSPTDELMERVERAHEALADAHRRWCRGSRSATR